jgi:proteasome assembly chaperone 3
MTHLTATTLLGGGNRGGERDVLGQLLATQIASEVTRRDPGEGRVLLLGLGLEGVGLGRDDFAACVGACLDVL